MHNLNYTLTTLGVQSWREIISGGTRRKRLNTTALDYATMLLSCTWIQTFQRKMLPPSSRFVDPTASYLVFTFLQDFTSHRSHRFALSHGLCPPFFTSLTILSHVDYSSTLKIEAAGPFEALVDISGYITSHHRWHCPENLKSHSWFTVSDGLLVSQHII
jgi:hypothetical protein